MSLFIHLGVPILHRDNHAWKMHILLKINIQKLFRAWFHIYQPRHGDYSIKKQNEVVRLPLCTWALNVYEEWVGAAGLFQKPIKTCVWVLQNVGGLNCLFFFFLKMHHCESKLYSISELTVTWSVLTGHVSHCYDESFMLQCWNYVDGMRTLRQMHRFCLWAPQVVFFMSSLHHCILT